MTTLLLQLLLQAVLILLNAIFACAEIAILSVNKAKMSAAAEKGAGGMQEARARLEALLKN